MKKRIVRKKFATALRDWRANQSPPLTMADASRLLGIPYRTWQDWELGTTEPRAFYRQAVLDKLKQ